MWGHVSHSSLENASEWVGWAGGWAGTPELTDRLQRRFDVLTDVVEGSRFMEMRLGFFTAIYRLGFLLRVCPHNSADNCGLSPTQTNIPLKNSHFAGPVSSGRG